MERIIPRKTRLFRIAQFPEGSHFFPHNQDQCVDDPRRPPVCWASCSGLSLRGEPGPLEKYSGQTCGRRNS